MAAASYPATTTGRNAAAQCLPPATARSVSGLAEEIFAAMPSTSHASPPLKLFAVSAHGAPRWLLSDDGSALDAVLASWSPYRRGSQMGWHAIRTASAAGLLQAMPGIESIALHIANSIDWQALGWRSTEPPALAIYIGTPGPAQKAVVHLISRESRTCQAVVKVPLAFDAKCAILREAETLAALRRFGVAIAPALLSLDRERGISGQQFLAGRPADRVLRPEYLALLRSLISTERHTMLAARARSHGCFADTMRGEDRVVLHAAIAALEDDRPLPAAWVHGDFAPWNLRCSPGSPPALIDWEDAQSQGMPLHDAYHFFHTQDYLFSGRPRLHADQLLSFAGSLGVTQQQCRALEVAYLIDAYRQCRQRGNVAHAGFLMRTLAIAVRNQEADRPITFTPRSTTDVSREATPRTSRALMFDALITNLNRAKISYCVLGGHDSDEGSVHDVDIVVSPADRPRLPEMLLRTARATGASLVQAIQHETTATYFILACAHAGGVTHLDVDCYTDYRRGGRTWLFAGDLIGNRRPHGDFFLPSVADEFTYYLLKKVLKQSITPRQLQRLQILLSSSPGECEQRIAKFWPTQARALRETIAEQDFHGLRRCLPALYDELQSAGAAEPIAARVTGKLRDLARLVRRTLRPTGMWIVVEGGALRERTLLAGELATRLAPAFRRIHVASRSKRDTSLTEIARLLAARVRSTVIVTVAEPVPRPRRRFHPLIAHAGERLLRPDLHINLDSERHSGRSNVDALADRWSAVALAWLAARLGRRLALPNLPAISLSCSAPENNLSPARSD